MVPGRFVCVFVCVLRVHFLVRYAFATVLVAPSASLFVIMPQLSVKHQFVWRCMLFVVLPYMSI